MCGRYYIDESMFSEIEQIVKDVQGKLDSGRKEVRPTNEVPIIKNNVDKLRAENLTWGFKHWDSRKSSVLINARAETVMERRMFKNSVMNRRCIVPATGFYEWNSEKKKIAFKNPDDPVLYMAGFFKDDRFIIVTTAANNSIADVHDRMPLWLNDQELEDWLYDPDAYQIILHKTPGKLDREFAGEI